MDNVAVINVIVADGNAVRRKSIIGRVIEVNSGEDGESEKRENKNTVRKLVAIKS